ncbi:hypothetical protein MKC73_00090 [[Clostridium] innocuum]|nr:hypothetical protein [[Clostridium] innocuum]
MNLLLAGFLAVTFLHIDAEGIKASEKSAVQTEVESLSDKWSESTASTDVYDTSEDTITITTAEQFVALQNEGFITSKYYFKGKTIQLGNDIDLGGKLWDKSIKNFYGTFDGQNYQIRNFVSNGAALFENLGYSALNDDGVIKNFAVSGSYYSELRYEGNSYPGGADPSGVVVKEIYFPTTQNGGNRASGIRNMVNQEIKVDFISSNSNETGGLSRALPILCIGGMFGKINNTSVSGCNNYGNIRVSFTESSVQKGRYGQEYAYGLSVGGVVGSIDGSSADNVDIHLVKCLNYGNINVQTSVPRAYVSVGGVLGDARKVADCDSRWSQSSNSMIYVQDCANFGNVTLNRGATEYIGNLASEDKESGALFAVGGVIGSTGRAYLPESKSRVGLSIDRVSNSGKITVIHNADVNNISEIGFIGGVMGLLRGNGSDATEFIVKNSNNTGKLFVQSDMTGLSTEGHYIAESNGTDNCQYLPKNMLFSGNFIGGVSSYRKPITLKNNFSTAEFESSMTDSSYLKASSFVSVYTGAYTADNDMLNTNYAPDAYKQTENTCGDDLSDSNKIYRSPRYRLRNADDSEDNYNSSPIPKYAGCSALGTLSNDYEFQEMNANSGETFDILMRDEAISKSPILTTIHKLRFTSENGGSWENSMGGDGTDSIISKEIPVYLTAYGKDTYNVGLVWGAMDFKYARTQESAQEQGLSLGWNGNDKKNNRLSITNNSVEPIYSNVSLNTARNTTLQDSNLEAKLDVEIFEKDAETPKETEAGTKSNGDVIVTKEHSIPTEATQHTYLTLSGQPQGDFDKKMIAMLLVTVSATQAGE